MAFNPRDVVAIPKDCDYAKIRTCRYTVIQEATGQLNDTTWPVDIEIDIADDDTKEGNEADEFDADEKDYDGEVRAEAA